MPLTIGSQLGRYKIIAPLGAGEMGEVYCARDGRLDRDVAIAAAAQALPARAGVVVDHPMDPSVVERIEALKASISKGTLDGLVAKARVLTPAEVLAMVRD